MTQREHRAEKAAMYGDHRLLPRYRKVDSSARGAQSSAVPSGPRPHTVSDPADAVALRGIPVIGEGVAGAMHGSRPDSAIEKMDAA